jgi:nicotinate phosphoribosyltransferase
VHDGAVVSSDGDPLHVQPVIRVRGRYRDFAILETSTLGILTRASRVATNVYETVLAARGKPILFFPARFDAHEVQAADGYAYIIAVERYNMDHASTLGPFVSTDAQGDWWGGYGGGTVAHAAIASFLGDTAEAMLAFADVLPTSIPRIALVDFNNDSVADSLKVCRAMFERFCQLRDDGSLEEAERYRLYGVRLDTSGSLRDVAVPPLGDPALDLGVNPRLVFLVRQALDNDWESWNLPAHWRAQAPEYCRSVKIVVSGGFRPEKIRRFEKLQVPVDIYAVGSSLFSNDGPTVTDYTADVVRVKVHGEWHDMAKVGRRPLDNPEMERVW